MFIHNIVKLFLIFIGFISVMLYVDFLGFHLYQKLNIGTILLSKSYPPSSKFFPFTIHGKRLLSFHVAVKWQNM